MNNNQTLPQTAPRRYWPFAIPEPTILPDATPSKKKTYLWLCFLIPAALMYLIYVILDVSFVIYLCQSGNGDGSLAEIWRAMVST